MSVDRARIASCCAVAAAVAACCVSAPRSRADVTVALVGDTMVIADSPGGSENVDTLAYPERHDPYPAGWPPGLNITTDLPARYMVFVEQGTSIGPPPPPLGAVTAQPPCATVATVLFGHPRGAMAYCPSAAVARIRLDMGDADDRTDFSGTGPYSNGTFGNLPITVPVDIALGDGNDLVEDAFGLDGPLLVDAGAGNDRVSIGGNEPDGPRGGRPGPAAARLIGGPGNDALGVITRAGDVFVDGGEGDDSVGGLTARPHTAHVIGGPGNDHAGNGGKLGDGFKTGVTTIDLGAGKDTILLPEFPGGSVDHYICGPGTDHLVATSAGPPRDDVYDDSCPPLGALRFASTGRLRPAAGAATIAVSVRNPVTLDATLTAGGTRIATAKHVRLARGRQVLRFTLTARGRGLAGKRSVRATLAGVADNEHGDRAKLTRASLGEATAGVARRFKVTG